MTEPALAFGLPPALKPRMAFGRRLGRRQWLYAALVAGALGVLLGASVSEARSLSSVFSTELKGLELEPLGPALADTVASAYPVASASSSVTYVFNHATEAFERIAGAERALQGGADPPVRPRCVRRGRGRPDALRAGHGEHTCLRGEPVPCRRERRHVAPIAADPAR